MSISFVHLILFIRTSTSVLLKKWNVELFKQSKIRTHVTVIGNNLFMINAYNWIPSCEIGLRDQYIIWSCLREKFLVWFYIPTRVKTWKIVRLPRAVVIEKSLFVLSIDVQIIFSTMNLFSISFSYPFLIAFVMLNNRDRSLSSSESLWFFQES